MIKITLDKEVLRSLKQKIIKALIIKRSYKGYVKYVNMPTDSDSDEPITPLNFEEFKEFDFWKIELSFRIYSHNYRKTPLLENQLTFKGIFL